MPIIQDAKKRMIEHGNSLEKICNGKCSDCVHDQRVYEGLISTKSSTLPSYVCPTGLAYGMRIERFCEENPTEYRSNIVLPTARKLILDSLGNFKPDKIRKDVKIIREYLVNEENIPEHKEEALTIISGIQPELKVSLSAPTKKRFRDLLPLI